MKTVIVIIVVLLVLAALAAAGVAMYRKQRSAQLQERFGPEYDRAVEGAPSKRAAEQHLTEVANRRDGLTLRDLDQAEQARFSGEWDVVQASFVDEPGQSVDAAGVLITMVMRERGYPVDSFDEQADLVAVDHPDVVRHYREAHAAHERHRSAGGVDTEDLRQSFVHYRALFAVLVRDQTTTTTSRAVAADPSATTVPDADSGSGVASDASVATAEPVTADTSVVTADAPVIDSGSRADVDSEPTDDARPTHPQETR